MRTYWNTNQSLHPAVGFPFFLGLQPVFVIPIREHSELSSVRTEPDRKKVIVLFLSVTMRFRFRVIVVHLEFQFSRWNPVLREKEERDSGFRVQKYSFSCDLTSATGI